MIIKRYAFIDVTNTKGSAKALGFSIDHQKLFDYLKKERWSCIDVYWYNGRIRNRKNENARKKIEEMGYQVKDKETHFFKKEHHIKALCPGCAKEVDFKVIQKKYPKANCDVELTVDCLELAENGAEFLIFSGDGDFRYLIERLRDKGVKVRLFSTSKQDQVGDYRFSTRLKDLLRKHDGDWIFFTELNNIKNLIKNDETATKRDGPER